MTKSLFYSIDRIIGVGKGNGFRKAKMMVPVFYYFLFFFAFQQLEGLNSFVALGQRNFSPLWPIFWTKYTDYASAASLIIVFFVFGSLAASFFWHYRIPRLLGFLGMLQYHALTNSFGWRIHQLDLWLWVGFLLVFLPAVKSGPVANPAPNTQKKFLLVFWVIQAFILLTYSMSGIGKIDAAFNQYLQGQATLFSPDAAVLHITTSLNRMQETALLGPLIVNYPLLGWIPLLLIVYLELFSFVIAFRPSLHRTWAAALILFHIGTYLTMRVVFVAPSALLLVFFLESPFQITKKWRQTILDLPVISIIGPVTRKKIGRKTR
jgi:hypothetical protein